MFWNNDGRVNLQLVSCFDRVGNWIDHHDSLYYIQNSNIEFYFILFAFLFSTWIYFFDVLNDIYKKIKLLIKCSKAYINLK